jgi:acid stress chaperone HdeB
MSPKPIVIGLVSSSIVLAAASTQAQVTVDVSKVTCDQYVHAKIATPLYFAAWLSGYYNAKRNNLIVDLQTLEENATKVQNYCSDEKNFKVPVMKAVERVLGGASKEPEADILAARIHASETYRLFVPDVP